MAALCNSSSKIQVGPKKYQKRVWAANKKPRTLKEIKEIVAAINRGEMNLPDVHLDNNEDYETCWALIDTGAGANVASHKRHFPGVAMDPVDPSVPKVVLSTASAQLIEGGDNFTITAQTSEGHEMRTTFVDADVDMPIISGAVLYDDDNDIVFSRNGGVVLHADGRQSRFIKRRGVYFMQLRIKRPATQSIDTGFARPRVA